MGVRGRLKGRRKAIASGATVTALAMTLSTFAALYDGVATADLDLDDGGVWVTRTADLLVGHLNYPARELDSAVRAVSSGFDILQSGNNVLIHDETTDMVSSVDVALAATSADIELPLGAEIALGGDTVAVAGNGMLYSSTAQGLGSATFGDEETLAEVGAGAHVAVSSSGDSIFSISTEDLALTSVAVDEEAEPEVTPLADGSNVTETDVTAVGENPVVLDKANGTLYLPEGKTAQIEADPQSVLQEPSADSSYVYVATSTALYEVALDGSEVTQAATVVSGQPARPVQLAGCAYSVWSGSAEFVRDCAGSDQDQQLTIDASAEANLVLRTNHRVVVVNDVSGGSVWVVQDAAEKVDNWDAVIPPADDSSEDEQESEDEQPQYELPERSDQNQPPVAADDTFGARTGRSTVLRVTDNDSDPDGDLLSASVVGSAPDGFEVAPVLNGAALQIVVPDDASGSVSFQYQVDDGRGGTDEATVTVQISPDGQNSPPEQRKVNTLQVELGTTVTYSTLDGWVDPDGDDVYLAEATVEGGDTITYRNNGVLEYTASSGETGVKTVALTVSDGTEETVGELRVDVRPAGTLSPIANADRVVALAGVPITISPLDNDVSLNGQTLRLAKIDYVDGATLTPDYTANTVEFVADEPGVYYFQYLVMAGQGSTPGIVRVDVLSGEDQDQPPVAVRDVALLPTGRDVLVEVLENDTDPAGGILVVQSATPPDDGMVSVEVLEHSVLRITDTGGLTEPTVVTYLVSNGTQSVRGEVVVMPVALPTTLRAPVAVEDQAVVRVGDVVTVSVLDNDYHPDGDEITLLSELAEANLNGLGTMFVDGDTIRFQAGEQTGEVTATYSIEDSQLNRVGGFLRIQILPADDENNSAPRAKAVTARAVAGTSTRIAIPLDGIDPDGDSVELVGITSNPAKGAVTVEGNWFVYEAHEQSYGMDSFTYLVRDRRGAEAESTVTVGIAQPAYENQAPYAVKDEVSVRPGRQVAVAVTVNDTDPDGDEIVIDPDGLVAPEGVTAKILGGRVVIDAPEEPGDYTFTYQIADVYGATATGSLLLTVDTEAALSAPVARDDRVQSTEIGNTGYVSVAVLDNDEDPDGTVDDLTIEVFNEELSVAGSTVTVPVLEDPMIYRYAVTDQDGLTGQAFIFVPGLDSLIPVLKSTDAIEVASGEQITIALSDYIQVREGREPRVAVADSVRTNHSNGDQLIVDEFTVSYTSAQGYFGPDSLGLLVTDGTGPDDPEGLTAFVAIPISVSTPPEENQPPTMRNTSVEVAAGEGETVLDLAELASDPDEDDQGQLEFTLTSTVPDLYQVSLDGSLLRITADEDIEEAQPFELTIEVSDPEGATAQGVVTVNTIVSVRALPVANDDDAGVADQGGTVAVDVLANDYNPYEDKEPLTLFSARVLSGSGEVAISGSTLQITPASDFVGNMLVSYRVRDYKDSADREAEAQVTLRVQGRPDAPGTPTVVTVEDRTVVLTWTPPSNNGAPITSYTVTSQNGYTKTCNTTTCTLDGLTNDVEYTFQVIATNEVGDSDPSEMSAVARPDARPDTPVAPTLEFGDSSLTVTWTTPESKGSPVLSYNLEITPAPATGSAQKTGVTGNSLTWEGLENGVAYQVRVQAVNRAPEPSEWSQYSAAVVPATVPDAPGQPQTTASTPVGSQAQIQVSWAAPASNGGDAVASYTLYVKRGGSVINTLQVTGTSQNVVVDTSQTDYTFAVTARNKAGDSATSAESAPRRGAVAPAAPASVSATEGDGSTQVTITPGSLNGSKSSEINWRYRVTPGGKTGSFGTSTTGTISGLSNGTTYTVYVWAESSVAGVSPGAEKASNTIKPYGKPIIRNLTSTNGDGKVSFTWSVDGNGRDVTSVKVDANHGGGASGGSGLTSYTASGLSASTTVKVTVTVKTNGSDSSRNSVSASKSGTSNPKQASVSFGRSYDSGKMVQVTTKNFPAGTYTYKCFTTSGEDGVWYESSMSFPANGTVETACWFGYPNEQVWVEIVGQYITDRITY